MSHFEEPKRAQEGRFNIERREFVKIAFGGAAWFASAGSGSAKLFPTSPGIKIGTYAQNPTEENMLYLKELGVKWITMGDITPQTATADGFTQMRKRWEAGGFMVYNESARIAPSGNAVINVPEIVLNLPGRDERIEEYLNYLRYLGEASIHYMTYGHMGNGLWRSRTATLPRGYVASDCDLARPDFQGRWNDKVYKTGALSHGREFTKDELWENYAYFIKKVAPVAEEAGVRIGIHPDDPPAPSLAGVPHLFSSFADYKRAIAIADSPNIGVCLCCGTWLEGGSGMGADPVEVIKYFAPQKKLFKIHFRNVTGPLPHFTETLMDDGYYNMYRIMEALVDVEFDGLVIPDHVPELGNPPGEPPRSASVAGAGGPFRPSPGLAYSIGYLNATLGAALSNRHKAIAM
jgi:mannonate dehydratase